MDTSNNDQQKNNKPEAFQDNGEQKLRFQSLLVDGTKYKTLLNRKFKERKKWDKTSEGVIYSEFPGTVVKVDVEEGDTISEGDRLYIYEAMKMKNRAYSPVDGKVKEVKIKEDEVIRKGDLLFVIE
ncbi:MAG: acetyl-CoA carboxylase biotin carboxyl carrier protein subunit [Bacteroidales bacterium]